MSNNPLTKSTWWVKAHLKYHKKEGFSTGLEAGSKTNNTCIKKGLDNKATSHSFTTTEKITVFYYFLLACYLLVQGMSGNATNISINKFDRAWDAANTVIKSQSIEERVHEAVEIYKFFQNFKE